MALPIFRELMMKIYGGHMRGPAPAFPDSMEQRITRYLRPDVASAVATAVVAPEMEPVVVPHIPRY